jgi:hypothetical protein
MDIRGTGAVPLPPLADPEPLGEDTHESQAADEVLGSLQRQAIAEEEEEQDRQGAHAGQPLSEPEPPAGRASASAQLPLDAGEGDAVSPSGKWRQLSGSVGKKYLEQLKSRNSLALAQVSARGGLLCWVNTEAACLSVAVPGPMPQVSFHWRRRLASS